MKEYELQQHRFSHRHGPILQPKHGHQLYHNADNATARYDANTRPLVFVPLTSPVPPQSFQHRNIQPPVYSSDHVPQPMPTPPFRAQSIPLETPLKTDGLTYYVDSGPSSSAPQPLVTATTTTTAMTMAHMTPSNICYYPHSSMQQATGPVPTIPTKLHPKYMEPGHYASANMDARHYNQQLHSIPPQMSISQSPQLHFQASPQLLTESQSHLNIPPAPRPIYGCSQLGPESHQHSYLQPMISGQSQNIVLFDYSRGAVNLQSSRAPIPTPILSPARSEDSQLQEGTTVTKEIQTAFNESESVTGRVNRVKIIPFVKRTSKPWSEKEDRLLLSLRGNEHLKWCQIASHFPNRTTNGCQFRWRRLMNKRKTARRE